jgi:DNA-binding NtrC family response regulator
MLAKPSFEKSSSARLPGPMVGAKDHRAVVVADDDAALTLLCKVNLELEGYRVLEGHSRADVERLVAEEDVRVVLLDIHLGSDNGVEVARSLRATRPDVGLIFLTGSAPILEAEHRDVVDAVLPKPFELSALINTVAEIFAAERYSGSAASA